MCFAGATLVRQLGLVGGGDPWLVEVISQLRHPDPAPIQVIKVEGGNLNHSAHQLFQPREISGSFSVVWQNSRAGF